MKKNIINIIRITILSVFFSVFFFNMSAKSENLSVEPENERIGMFSWKSIVFKDGGTEIFSFMKQHKFTELYQAFSSDLDDAAILVFLQNADNEGIDIYMLAGDPSWANDSGGRQQLKVVEEAARINKLAGESVIKGIVFDIEPYLLDSWNSKSKKIMERFISGMKKTYEKAASQSLKVVLCIPFYYDNMGLKGELEKLIQHGCDRVAIMNYFKEKEANNIEREVKYAIRYNKGVINIYEFKAPGQHGLREVNTYYKEGFEAAVTSFNVIKESYPDSGITMAAHDYEALKEVLKEDIEEHE